MNRAIPRTTRSTKCSTSSNNGSRLNDLTADEAAGRSRDAKHAVTPNDLVNTLSHAVDYRGQHFGCDETARAQHVVDHRLRVGYEQFTPEVVSFDRPEGR